MLVYLIIGFVVVILVGNFMGARPKDDEIFVESVRMIARQLRLMPRLLPTPNWLKQYTTHKMVIIYSVVNDDWRLPLACYINDNGMWKMTSQLMTSERKSDIKLSKKAERLIGAIDLPVDVQPFVLGLVVQANSVSIAFDDRAFVKAFIKKINQKSLDDTDALKVHLMTLKDTLMAWGDKVSFS